LWLRETNASEILDLNLIFVLGAGEIGKELVLPVPQQSFSFTPGFSPVERLLAVLRNRFNGFHGNARKPLKRFSAAAFVFATGLKPGVNEKDF
jgi:hypothetical protein